jgi:hypothetical protein
MENQELEVNVLIQKLSKCIPEVLGTAVYQSLPSHHFPLGCTSKLLVYELHIWRIYLSLILKSDENVEQWKYWWDSSVCIVHF